VIIPRLEEPGAKCEQVETMNIKSIIIFLALALFISPAQAQERPVTGKKAPGYEPVDQAILDFMNRIGCSAATAAISKDGQLLYSHGYGWSDKAKSKPVQPDALMRIASVTKPFTSAAIRNAIRADLLTLDTKAFELLAIKPPVGKIADPRINTITIRQLLNHRGGWDRDKSFDPMFRDRQIERDLGLGHPCKPVNVVEYMLTKPLQFDPGEKSVYSNFGYCVLGRVLEKVMKKPYFECIEESVLKPLGIKDIKLGHSASNRRDPREVSYPVADNAFSLDIMDAHGGLIASAPALCQFLDGYWINGDPRKKGQRGTWFFFGSLPGTTSMVYQRPDGYNIAILLNGRRDKTNAEDNDVLKQSIEKAVDKVSKGK
jgi:CubicO group peptidase (beta-lactamase class C family)